MLAANENIVETSVGRPACLWQENPYGLVSLWDMLQQYAFGFYEVVCSIEHQYEHAKILFSINSPRHVSATQRSDLSQSLVEMRKECDVLNLDHTSGLISHHHDQILRKGDGYTFNELLTDLDTLRFSFSSELRKRFFFRIKEGNERHFQKEELFGREVGGAFPSCVTDIQNAGNCYALEQYEATAFHSMRVLERGLNALATKFGVDFSHTNWHNVIEQIENKIRKMDSSFGADWKEQQAACSQAATHFMFLKDAWRNNFVHGRDLPYDSGRAFSVFDHVGQFMRVLAASGLKD